MFLPPIGFGGVKVLATKIEFGQKVGLGTCEGFFIYAIWENGTTYSSQKKEPEGYIGYLAVAWHAVSQIGIR